MKTFLIIIFCLLLLPFIAYILLFLYNKYLDLYNKYLNKKNAKLKYESAKIYYEHLMLVRRLYHESKFIDNELEKNRIQAKCISDYNEDIEFLESLSDPNAEFRKFLTEKQTKDLEETLSLPRYKLL